MGVMCMFLNKVSVNDVGTLSSVRYCFCVQLGTSPLLPANKAQFVSKDGLTLISEV